MLLQKLAHIEHLSEGPRKGERRVVWARETAQNATERCRGVAGNAATSSWASVTAVGEATHGLQKILERCSWTGHVAAR